MAYHTHSWYDVEHAPITADVIVYKEGDKAVAKDSKGRIIAESDEHYEVIQAGIDYVASKGGGKIEFQYGKYKLSNYIELRSNIIYEGNYSILYPDSSLTSQLIVQHGYDPADPNIGTQQSNIIFRRFILDGKLIVDRGIRARLKDFIIEDCIIKNCIGYGIALVASEHSVVRNNFIYGDGVNTKDAIKVSASSSHISIISNHAYDMIDDHISCDHSTYITIAYNIVISDQHDHEHGISAWGDSHFIKIIGNTIVGMKKDGIHVTDYQGSVPSHIHIAHNQIYNVGENGIQIRGYGDTYLEHFVITDNIIKLCGGYGIYGIRVRRGVIKGNHIEGTSQLSNGTYDAIRIDYDGTHTNTHIIISDNEIVEELTNKPAYAINLRNAANSNIRVEGNVLIGVTSLNVFPTINIVKRNVGYLTENSGVATFSGDGTTTQFTIPHGLVTTPSKVRVTPRSADAAGDFYITVDATNIYVNYITAPPSGTDNVVLEWEAEV